MKLVIVTEYFAKKVAKAEEVNVMETTCFYTGLHWDMLYEPVEYSL